MEAAGINVRDFDLGKIVGGLDNSWRFVRYGDFELFAMAGVKMSRSRPKRGKVFATPEVARDLWSTFCPVRKKPFYYAIQPLCIREGYVPEALAPVVNWLNADVFHKANMKGQLYPLVAWLREHRVGLVGPRHLTTIPFLNTGGHVEIPFGAVNLERDRVLDEIHSLVTQDVDAVAFSASYLANFAIHMFSDETRAALMDFGSIWEPYVGVNNRGYHKSLSDETKHKNLWGE
jgi:hypothetical protein